MANDLTDTIDEINGFVAFLQAIIEMIKGLLAGLGINLGGDNTQTPGDGDDQKQDTPQA